MPGGEVVVGVPWVVMDDSSAAPPRGTGDRPTGGARTTVQERSSRPISPRRGPEARAPARPAPERRRPGGSSASTKRPRRTREARRLITLSVTALVLLGGLIGYALRREQGWRRAGPPVSVSAWAPYWQTDAALESFLANREVFSDLSLFAFQATGVDDVAPFDGLSLSELDTFRKSAHAAGVLLTGSVIDGTAPREMAAILADPESRKVHVQAIVDLARDNGLDGIDLDYEKFAFNDGRSTWEGTRPHWVAFVQDLADALHDVDKTLTVSVPSSGDYPVYDYEAMGKVVDKIRIMAYDYSTSEPGPIAPIDWVRDVVESAKKLVPGNKLVLGVPVYGYDWVVGVAGTCPGGDDDEPGKRSLSTTSATELAASKGITPTWDAASEERTFTYTDQLSGVDLLGAPVTCTVTRVVWYADAEAVHARAFVAERAGLSGISIWSLGSDDKLTWDGIDAARADIEEWPEQDDDTTVATGSSDASVVSDAVTGG